MAVGDYVFDKTKPPPLLETALNYEKWGIGDIMRLPAGSLWKLNTALSYYRALSTYIAQSGKTVQWTKNNPQSWDMVSWVIAQRKKRKDGDSNQ